MPDVVQRVTASEGVREKGEETDRGETEQGAQRETRTDAAANDPLLSTHTHTHTHTHTYILR